MENISDTLSNAILNGDTNEIIRLVDNFNLNDHDIQKILTWSINNGLPDITKNIILSERYNNSKKDKRTMLYDLKDLLILRNKDWKKDRDNFNILIDVFADQNEVNYHDVNLLLREIAISNLNDVDYYIKKIIDTFRYKIDVDDFANILDYYVTIFDIKTNFEEEEVKDIIGILISSYIEVIDEDQFITLINKMIERYRLQIVFLLLDTYIWQVNSDYIESLIGKLIDYKFYSPISIIINSYGNRLTEDSIDKIVKFSIENDNVDLLRDVVEKDLYFDFDRIITEIRNEGYGFNEVATKLLQKYDDTQEKKGIILDKLQSSCNNDVDPISQVEFYKLPINQVKNIVRLKNGNCYDPYSLYNYVEQKIKSNRPITDPLNPSYRINEHELQNVYDFMSSTNKKFTPPVYVKFEYPPGYRLVIEQYDNFYHIIVESLHGYLDLGYIPSDVNYSMTGSTNLTSSVLISNIQKLWDMGRLLIRNEGEILRCCTVSLNKTIDYWYDKDKNIDIKKFIDLAEQVSRFTD